MKRDQNKDKDAESPGLNKTMRDDSANQNQQTDSKNQNINPYEQNYFDRQEKEIPSDSIVAILIEMTIFEPVNGTHTKVIPGQIGFASSPTQWEDGYDYYEVTFFDKKKYIEVLKEKQYDMYETLEEVWSGETEAADEVWFASASFRRDQLLHLDSDVSFSTKSETVTLSDLDTTSKHLIEFFQHKAHTLLDSTLPTLQFKPGDLVTILIDFMKKKSPENSESSDFTVDIYAGEIGIILDPKKDTIQMSDESSILVEDVLPENASMVFFPKYDLFEIITLIVKQDLKPFTENNCMSINNAFLLSLCTEKRKKLAT